MQTVSPPRPLVHNVFTVTLLLKQNTQLRICRCDKRQPNKENRSPLIRDQKWPPFTKSTHHVSVSSWEHRQPVTPRMSFRVERQLLLLLPDWEGSSTWNVSTLKSTRHKEMGNRKENTDAGCASVAIVQLTVLRWERKSIRGLGPESPRYKGCRLEGWWAHSWGRCWTRPSSRIGNIPTTQWEEESDGHTPVVGRGMNNN